jgi:tripartite-type tricarboxylate transporter receptor subunit TctC
MKRILFPLLLLGCLSAPVHAQDTSGKSINLFVGTTSGGGYDVYARVLARYWRRYLAGHPAFVVKNMPGAGGLTMANYMYNQAPRDGSEIATMQSGVIFEKLYHTLSPNGANARFEAEKFGWIGSALRSTYVTITWHDSPVKTLEDAKHKDAVLGASTTSSDNFLLAVLGNKLLGTKFRIVHGYQGSTATDLAIERGEINGAAGKDWTTLTTSRPDWLKEKKINIIVQMGMQKHPSIPDVPSALELAANAEDRTLMELVFAKFNLSRPFFGPPQMTPKAIDDLRSSFMAVLKDKEFLNEAEKTGMEIDPVFGPEAEKLVARLLQTPPAQAQKMRDLLKP